MDSFLEKSEKPSAKKLKKAQEEGQHPHSNRFAFALFLVATFITIAFYSNGLTSQLKESFKKSFSLAEKINDIDMLLPVLFATFRPLIITLFSLLILFFFILFVAHGWQSSFSFSFNSLKWSWPTRTNQNRVYSFFISMVALLGVALLGCLFIYRFNFYSLPIDELPSQQGSFLSHQLFIIGIKVLLFFLLLFFFDYLFQRYFFFKKMHMTKEEVKEEQREDRVGKSNRRTQ